MAPRIGLLSPRPSPSPSPSSAAAATGPSPRDLLAAPAPAPTLSELEAVEAEMYRDLYRALPRRVARDLGVSFEDRPSGLFFRATGFDHPFFNRVMIPPRVDGALLAEALAHYRDAGVSRWMLQVAPGRRGGLPRSVWPQGMTELRGWSKHVGHVEWVAGPGDEVLAPGGIRIVEVPRDPDTPQALAWAEIVSTGFGMHPGFVSWMAALADRPRWRLFLARAANREGGEPLAAAALYRPPSHPHLAQLNLAATRAEARGRGAQSALVVHRREEARVLGVRWLVSESDEDLPERPNPSHRNLVRLGLRVRYVRSDLGPRPPERGMAPR